MGGNKSKGKHFASQATQMGMLGAQMAKQLFGETQPSRESFYQTWENMMAGNLPGGAFPQMYQATRMPIESQYDVARQNVLEQIPAGGQLDEALANVELARSQGLQEVIANLYGDELTRMYGAAFGAPQLALQSLLGISQQGVQTQQAMAQGAASGCCFNFLEAEGEIYPTVARFRDDHFPKDGAVGKGYYLTASLALVPLMKKYRLFKAFIRFFMTKPLKSYSQWFYGENHHGFIFSPIAGMWVSFWGLLGK